MELRHLRYFVAVAEELNFTRAAQRLGINQPGLSLQIRQLEKELGSPLFYRRARSVELTNPGKLLLEEARVILKQVERAKIGVRRRARGESGRINIGCSDGTYFHPLIPAIIREFRTHYPNVVLFPQASGTSFLVAQLRAGQIDIAFIRTPIADSEGLALELLVHEPATMVLPSGHPLSRATSAPLAAFANETFVLCPRQLNPTVYDMIIAALRSAVVSPILGQEAPTFGSCVPMVAAGLGVSIVPRSIGRLLVHGVSYVSIEGDAPVIDLTLAHRRDDRSPAVRNFVAIARRQCVDSLKSVAGKIEKVSVPRH
jgi:DNA-binding transcriptional LysR family regulator